MKAFKALTNSLILKTPSLLLDDIISCCPPLHQKWPLLILGYTFVLCKYCSEGLGWGSTCLIVPASLRIQVQHHKEEKGKEML